MAYERSLEVQNENDRRFWEEVDFYGGIEQRRLAYAAEAQAQAQADAAQAQAQADAAQAQAAAAQEEDPMNENTGEDPTVNTTQGGSTKRKYKKFKTKRLRRSKQKKARTSRRKKLLKK